MLCGSALAPILQYLTNLAYQLMRAIQSVAYALTGVNIFAKASASSMKGVASGAKKAKEETKSLAGIHDELNNVSNNNNENGSSGIGSATPSFDLSQMDNTPNSLVEAIKNGDWYQVGVTIGEKLNNAMLSIPWDTIQNGAKNIATGIGECINGFVDGLDWNLLGSTLGNGINTAFIFMNTFLTTINWGNIGTAIATFLNSAILTTDWNLIGTTFANKLNAIIHFGYNFVTTFDWTQFGIAIGSSINGFINNIDWATAGQMLGEGIKGIFNSISSFLEEVDWTLIGENVKIFIQNIDWIGIWDTIKETIKSAIGSIDEILTGFFGENATTIIESIAISIGLVTVATKLYTLSKSIETGVLLANAAAWIAANAPIILITAAIAAIIAIIILCIKHWDEIKETIINVCNNIKETISQWIENIKQWFSNMIETIKTNWNNFWSNLFSKCTEIINNIKTGIENWINNIKIGISTALENIKNIWNNIWNGLKTTITNIFNGIWSAVKGVINSILGGIEGMANGVVNGINFVIKALNKLKFDIPDWVPGLGGKTFGFSIGLIPQVSLPRLAKGGVLTQPTTVLAGEYAGARSNPEIVTPQNIMYDTMRKAIEDTEFHNGNNQQHLSIYYMGKEIFDDTIDYINEKTRRTGKCVIKVT